MQMQIGDKAETTRLFSQSDINTYIALGGARPAETEVPEPLLGALFSYLLGMKIPGVGTKYLKQETEFENTAYIGQNLTASVEITDLRLEKYLVDLKTLCHDEKGTLICSGRALVYVKDVK